MNLVCPYCESPILVDEDWYGDGYNMSIDCMTCGAVWATDGILTRQPRDQNLRGSE